ncbi:SIR2 family protein [Anatilimnocola sp. NA78]|uniref:SIR2 family protein n=1 Tax=Anatilimnocola sp. NA78 TaxID=3415683 RepID=UPI003CE4F85D
MAAIDRKIFIREYSEAMRNGSAAMFVGAGVSKAAGYVDWKGLLKEIAEDLGLDVERESDLITLAQFHLNERKGRDKLNQILVDEFLETHEPTRAHKLIASLPLGTIWTTNYDDLLEKAFELAGKRVDVKRHKDDINFTRRRTDVTIYKMHGDKTAIAEAVLAKDDYETYHPKRELFSIALKGDLTQKTFLFIGVSFTDPNLAYILNRVRQLVDAQGRKHFCLLRQPRPEDYKGAGYDVQRFKHFLVDLERYNIKPVLLDSYNEIPEILNELNRRSHLRDVLISGSAADFMPLGEEKLRAICRELGRVLVKEDFNVISGFGHGIGGDVITGALQSLPRNDDQRLKLWPFPQEIPDIQDRAAFWTEYRKRMIAEAGICVVISGNKRADDRIDRAQGVREEARLTLAEGKIVLPIGATGHVARELWDEVSEDLPKFFGSADVAKPFAILGDETAPVDELVKAVTEILKALNK